MGDFKAEITISKAIDVLDHLTVHPNYRIYDLDDEIVQQALFVAIQVLKQQERRKQLYDVIGREE